MPLFIVELNCMYKDIIQQKKPELLGVVDRVKTELASIRTGRAHSSMVEDIQVEYMGSRMRIRELATISTPEPRVIQIQPWDKSAIPLIEKGIKESSLGLNPNSDAMGVRLSIPPLTEDRRKEMAKTLWSKVEEGRIKVRQIREDIIKKVQNEVKEKIAREDDLRRAKEEVQKIVDDVNHQLDDLGKKKEQELMTI